MYAECEMTDWLNILYLEYWMEQGSEVDRAGNGWTISETGAEKRFTN